MGIMLSITPPVLLAGAAIFSLWIAMRSFSITDEKIPVVGAGSGPLAVLIASVRSVTSFRAWIAEGYRKHRSSVFKIRHLHHWFHVVSSPELIDEVRRAPEDVLSFLGALEDALQAEYTFGDWRDSSLLHVALIKSRLTRSLEHLFPAAVDELHAAFADEISDRLAGNDWTPLAMMDPILRVVCRTSNRLFVGLPLCRDPEFVDLGVGYTRDVVTSAAILGLFPSFLKPIVRYLFTPMPRTHARARRILTGFLAERRRMTDENAHEWEGRPDDFLQWILDTGTPRDREIEPLIMILLRMNFAAIPTTTPSFVFALYRIAAEPEKYQAPIRREVHEALERYGWTKAAMDHMPKLDSFLREVQRHDGLGATTMSRKALRDFQFSDGTTIRKGKLVCVAVHDVHHDRANYRDPDTFDGFRFCEEMHSSSDDRHRLVSTSMEYLAFGLGRHACPGRFWAANEMKAMMSYMLTHYELKMTPDGELPRGKWLGLAFTPDEGARVLVRRRDADAEPVY